VTVATTPTLFSNKHEATSMTVFNYYYYYHYYNNQDDVHSANNLAKLLREFIWVT